MHYKKITLFNVLAIILFSILGCSGEQSTEEATSIFVENPPTYPSQTLPEGLQWQTNNSDPIFAAEAVEKGGTYRTFMLAFPLTLRSVGPDSNSSFRSYLDGNRLSLTTLHPNTKNVLPVLATHWAYADDNKTVYYKLNPDVTWSDGKPVTADDYLFTLDFMRSKHIVAPWYNNHYTEQITQVTKYDDYTISVTGATAKPKVDLHYYYGLSPMPRHFHKLDENWVTDYNWRIEPTVGPYYISSIKKGKYVEFSRQQNWWGENLRYFKNRFNVDKVRISVIRDAETAYRHFLKGQLDTFSLVLPAFWHDKATGEEYENGYIQKIWFYNDIPQPSSGMYLNQKAPLLEDINVRSGLAHAMNIEKMIQVVLRGDYQRLHNIHTGYGEFTNTAIKARTFDLQKADEYFKAAGWVERGPDGILTKEGSRLSFEVNYSAPHHTDRLVVLKEEAKKAGVDLILEQMDASASFKKILEKKHQIAWMGWSTGFRPAYWQHFHSDNANKPQTNNITNMQDSELDAMIMEYRAATDNKERARLAGLLQQKIHDSAVYIPTYSVPYTREAYWRWVHLPKHFGTKSSAALFEPFGASSGGLFWITDRQSVMEDRKSDKKYPANSIINTQYKPE